MRTVFADTSFFVAFLSVRDPYARQAQDFVNSYTGWLVTTTHVLAETGNFRSRSQSRTRFSKYVEELQAIEEAEIVPESADLWNAGLSLYGTRPDKSWSLTDCLSFIVMQDRGLTEALTADRHFEQAGFAILLK
jgi:predicted nucleic acid-binding protein